MNIWLMGDWFFGVDSFGGWPASRGLPGGNSLFFVSPKKRKQKKGDPAVCDPLRLRYGGNLRCSVQPGPGSNSLRS
ncbi:MAG TPA: hypothetical protein PKX42_10770, partial [Polaromonas sp.]|nr:hypothetical protein [Polaromonas sp.]HQS40706.1 hypothetical protein [Polaromonas sp.]HQS88647.1 hypothetical protein [Polaromonas sp.]